MLDIHKGQNNFPRNAKQILLDGSKVHESFPRNFDVEYIALFMIPLSIDSKAYAVDAVHYRRHRWKYAPGRRHIDSEPMMSTEGARIRVM